MKITKQEKLIYIKNRLQQTFMLGILSILLPFHLDLIPFNIQVILALIMALGFIIQFISNYTDGYRLTHNIWLKFRRLR